MTELPPMPPALAPAVSAPAVPPAPTVTVMFAPGVTARVWQRTPPPPPPPPDTKLEAPEPPPPPTTSTLMDVTPAGTVQDEVPTVVKEMVVEGGAPFQPTRTLPPETGRARVVVVDEATSAPSTYCFMVEALLSPCTTATWCHFRSQTPAIGPGVDAMPEPRTLRPNLKVEEATAGTPHSNTEACAVDAKGAQRTKALRLMDASPLGSDAGIDVDVSR